jgi:hypothetical protein
LRELGGLIGLLFGFLLIVGYPHVIDRGLLFAGLLHVVVGQFVVGHEWLVVVARFGQGVVAAVAPGVVVRRTQAPQGGREGRQSEIGLVAATTIDGR